MTGVVRAESRNLDVVVQQVRPDRDFVVFAREKLFLVIETGAPGEIAPDLQILAQTMAHHVRRVDAFGWFCVVRAPGRVNVVIPRPPAELRRVDPTLEFEGERLLFTGHLRRFRFRDIFRTARVFDGVFAGRQLFRLAVGAIHLRMKSKVRREPLGLRRINAPLIVPNDEHRGGWLPVFVKHVKSHFAGRQNVEQRIHIVAITDVLRPLPDVERDLRLPLAGVATVKLEDPIFEVQAAQQFAQRLLAEHLQIEPQLGRIRPRRIPALAISLIRRRRARPALVQRERVRAHRAQFGRHPGFVVDFDQELPPALFSQFRFRRSRRDLHARLRVDVHAEQTILVEHALDGFAGLIGVGLLERRFQRLFVGVAERCP